MQFILRTLILLCVGAGAEPGRGEEEEWAGPAAQEPRPLARQGHWETVQFETIAGTVRSYRKPIL